MRVMKDPTFARARGQRRISEYLPPGHRVGKLEDCADASDSLEFTQHQIAPFALNAASSPGCLVERNDMRSPLMRT